MRAVQILFLLLLLAPTVTVAETREIIAEGTYNMGDGETPSVAESRALLQAKQCALEQAGTYVESYSKVRNITLTQDEVRVLTAGLMEVDILEKKRTIMGDGIAFWVRIKARVNPDRLEEMAKSVKERSIVEEYKKIQDAYAKSREEMEELKKQLAALKGEKSSVEAKMVRLEKWFQANEWTDRGKHHWLNREYDDAVVACSVALLLDPDSADAHLTRGIAYGEKGRYDKALEDFTRAIEINPKAALAYYNRGLYRQRSGDYAKAVEDYSKAIRAQPRDADAYCNRGLASVALGKTTEAVADFLAACSMGSEAACKHLPGALPTK